MGKLILIVATCLLAMSVGTLLVEGGKHKHAKHQKKNAAHLKAKAGHKDDPTGPTGEELYNDATAFVDAAEECLRSFENNENHTAAVEVLSTAHTKLDGVISLLTKSHPKKAAPKSGSVGITQNVELDDADFHTFDTKSLSHGTLKKLKAAADKAHKEAKKVEHHNKVSNKDKKTFHTEVTALIKAVENMENELGIQEPIGGETSEIDFEMDDE